MFGVKCFSIFSGLVLADSNSGEFLMPNDLIDLVFHINHRILVGMKLHGQDVLGKQQAL